MHAAASLTMDLVLQFLGRHPHDRYAPMREFVDELRATRAGDLGSFRLGELAVRIPQKRRGNSTGSDETAYELEQSIDSIVRSRIEELPHDFAVPLESADGAFVAGLVGRDGSGTLGEPIVSARWTGRVPRPGFAWGVVAEQTPSNCCGV